jgi:hypothetical protein
MTRNRGIDGIGLTRQKQVERRVQRGERGPLLRRGTVETAPRLPSVTELTDAFYSSVDRKRTVWPSA